MAPGRVAEVGREADLAQKFPAAVEPERVVAADLRHQHTALRRREVPVRRCEGGGGIRAVAAGHPVLLQHPVRRSVDEEDALDVGHRHDLAAGGAVEEWVVRRVEVDLDTAGHARVTVGPDDLARLEVEDGDDIAALLAGDDLVEVAPEEDVVVVQEGRRAAGRRELPDDPLLWRHEQDAAVGRVGDQDVPRQDRTWGGAAPGRRVLAALRRGELARCLAPGLGEAIRVSGTAAGEHEPCKQRQRCAQREQAKRYDAIPQQGVG